MRVTIIDRAEAQERFETGHVVGLVPTERIRGGEASPIWHHVAVRYHRTFERFAEPQPWWGDVEVVFVKPAARRRTIDESAGHIFRLEDFTIGNMRGQLFDKGQIHCGDLPDKYCDALRADLDRYGAAYIVWSYDTIIAWRLPGGTVTMPPVRYSNTTTQHQYVVARALGVPFTTTESAREGKGKSPYGGRRGGW